MPKISVIVPTMPGRELLYLRLVGSLPGEVEVVAVPDSHLLLAAKRNKGARLATGDIFLFIDDDNYLHPSALYGLKDVDGILGLTACYDDDQTRICDGGSKRSMTSGFMLGINTNRDIEKVRDKGAYEVDEVANAFMMSRKTFEALGGFDEKNFPIDLDEADLCRRAIKSGFKVRVDPSRICYHKSITYSYFPDFRRPMNAYFMGRNRILFQRKHLSAGKYLCYLTIFFPIFLTFYVLTLTARLKFKMIPPFLKGVIDGIRNRLENQYQ